MNNNLFIEESPYDQYGYENQLRITPNKIFCERFILLINMMSEYQQVLEWLQECNEVDELASIVNIAVSVELGLIHHSFCAQEQIIISIISVQSRFYQDKESDFSFIKCHINHRILLACQILQKQPMMPQNLLFLSFCCK